MVSAAESDGQWTVHLLGQWLLTRGGVAVPIPRRARRLVAYLGVRSPVPRSVVAAGLWPDSSEDHARSNLRSTTRRVRREAPGLLGPLVDPLTLADGVQVDLQQVLDLMERAQESDVASTARRLVRVGPLLPGWYDDWVLLEGERMNQLLVVNLAHLAEKLLDRGELTEALEAVTRCIRLEPLRESSHRLLVQVHLAAGDRVAAWQAYHQFRQSSLTEFGLAPDRRFEELVEPLRQERSQRRHQT